MLDSYNYTVADRLMEYVTIDTQSDPGRLHSLLPKNKKDLSRLLVKQLLEIGINDAHLDEYGYVYATIPLYFR